MIDKDVDYYNDAKDKSRKKQVANTTERDRRMNFKLDVLFGPIFICSCCERKLQEKSVTKIKPTFKEKVNKKRDNFFCVQITACYWWPIHRRGNYCSVVGLNCSLPTAAAPSPPQTAPLC